MKRILFNIAVLLIVAAGGVLLLLLSSGTYPAPEGHQFDQLHKILRIDNLVTAIYLGPRVFDTLFEVTVVILTVAGIAYLKEEK